MAVAGMAQLNANMSLMVWRRTVWQTYQAEANLLEQLCHPCPERMASGGTRRRPRGAPGVRCAHCPDRGRGTGAAGPGSCCGH